MQRWIPMLAVVLCVQVLIAGALFLRKDALAGAPPNAAFVTAPIHDADHIVIDSQPATGKPAAPIDLVERNGAWLVHSEFDVPADKSKVGDLLAKLGSLRRGLPIADTPDALRRFRVSHDRFARRITLGRGGRTIATLYLGESAGLHKSDARSSGEHQVYTVGIATYDVPADAGAWIQADLLRVSAAKLDSVDITGADGARLSLTRSLGAGKVPGAWTATGLARGRTLDETKVASLVDAIGTRRVQAALGTQANPDWRTDHPSVGLTFKEADGKVHTWSLSTPKSGDYVVLKSAGRPWYFSVDATLAKPLIDAGAPAALAMVPPKPQRPAAKPHHPAARSAH